MNCGRKTMKAYEHKVQYYETDKMQFTHHSNYIRFMEEARIAYLDHMTSLRKRGSSPRWSASPEKKKKARRSRTPSP